MPLYTVIKDLLKKKRVKVLTLKNKIFFIISIETQKYYFWIVKFLFIKKIKSFLLYLSEGSNPSFYLKSVKDFLLWQKRIEKRIIKRIIIRGLGLKAVFIKDLNILQLKLGFSQLINITVPNKKISLVLFKRRIVVVGRTILEVNQFAQKIKSFKLPNIYKGKGLWYRNEKIILKPVRKT